jgi:hypothetical protein
MFYYVGRTLGKTQVRINHVILIQHLLLSFRRVKNRLRQIPRMQLLENEIARM